ncbi:MAG: mannose-phosphate guanylyltransferase [Pseudomonadota bacterium]
MQGFLSIPLPLTRSTMPDLPIPVSTAPAGAIVPVILSGGAGSRLWPHSREKYPKQLLPLVSDRSMIQDTVLRVAGGEGFAAPLIVCNNEHRFVIAEQMAQIGVAPAAIVLEPMGRNTAPAVAVAARLAQAADAGALLLVLPADHAILDETAFQAAVATGTLAAQAGHLVTFGITPTAPETGYGYIEAGQPVAAVPGAFHIARFTEKPARAVAEAYLADGRHAWNSGMFLFAARTFLEELERWAPEVLRAADQAIAAASRDLDFLRLGADAFAVAPGISIDYAVMEKTERAVVVPAEMGWTDVGAWSALWQIAPKDAAGNVALGDVMLVDSSDCYVRSPHALTAVVGVKDVVVVATEDAVLVADRSRVQDVKTIVDRLKSAGRSEPLEHKRVYRPWGFYQGVHAGDGFQVKRITVHPGRKLSLQKHQHRSEHWVVVHGTAVVTVDDTVRTLNANQSIYIPLGAVHRLENPGPGDLHLIEVQTGSYLGEDDIVRLEDTYGRT